VSSRHSFGAPHALECSVGEWRVCDFGIMLSVIDRRFMRDGACSARSDSVRSRFTFRFNGTQFA